MKNLFLLLFGLILNLTQINAQTPDVLIDKAAIQSPYWGLKFESGTVTDATMNCGNSNTNFTVGSQYLLVRFPINLANMGNSVAYFGRYGQNGITHDSCYNPLYTNATDFINIPNFVITYLLDSCGNVINWNRKTDWNIQNNSQYAISIYNGQTTYLTQTYGLSPTTGTSPNPLKDWLEPLCGILNPNLALDGRTQMDNYYNNCQICDSLVLFPNYVSSDYSVIQLPTNLSPGNYYLSLSGNFYMLNQGTNCYPDSIAIPFNWNGSFGISNTYPYAANGITFLNSISCTPAVAPSPVLTTDVNSNGGSTVVNWNGTGTYTSFEITPIYVQGNTERRVTNRTVNTSSSSYTFSNQTLIQDARALGAGNGTIKYRFVITAINGNLRSNEVKTKTTNVR